VPKTFSIAYQSLTYVMGYSIVCMLGEEVTGTHLYALKNFNSSKFERPWQFITNLV